MTNTAAGGAKRFLTGISERLSDAQTLGLFSLAIIGIGILVVWMQNAGGIALLWSLGCLAVGALGGFVFGIPRVQQDAPDGPPGDGAAPAPAPSITRRKYKLLANTNLEQISDWLTKILVGVGLVEAKEIPGYLGRLAGFVGPAIRPNDDHGRVFALAVTLHFAVWGFICSYLMTRVYLTGTFFRAEGGDTGENAGAPEAAPPAAGV